MTDIKSRNNICSQGYIQNEQPFMIVGVVKEGMSAKFLSTVNITDADDKCFVLCSCQLLENPQQTILYLSNDPNDFIYNSTKTARNNGILPVRREENNFIIDIMNLNNPQSVGLPINSKMNLSSPQKIIKNDLDFFTIDGNLSKQGPQELSFGIPYKMTFANNQRINFYTRKNVTTANNGRTGPSIAHFAQSSTIFEELKTHSIALEGISPSFSAARFNEFGMSLLSLDTPTEAITLLPKENRAGIIELKQGTSTWFNIFNNPSGTSTVFLQFDSSDTFLNIGVCTPITTGVGISVKINLRNKESNFILMDDVTAGVSEVFDYYFVNSTGFTVGGLANDSSQYFNNLTGDIEGGLCYFMNKNYTYHNFFRQENTKGLVANLNCLNNTPITRTTTDSSKLTSYHITEDSTNYSSYYDSLYGIDFNANNDYSQNGNCGTQRTTEAQSENLCGLQGDSDQGAKQGKNIFTDSPHEKEQTFIVEMVVMSILVFIYIAFAIYYYNLEV